MLKTYTEPRWIAKKYCDAGPYPHIGGMPVNPRSLHGGVMFLGDVSTGVAICYRDFPVTEFIEVCWSTR